jgi:signal peptidase I
MTNPDTTPAPEAARPAPEPGTGEIAWEWFKSIAFAILLWVVFRTFLFEAFRIPSQSMERTLLVGDFLFVNKAVYGAEVPFLHWHLPAYREPARGDILIFDSVEPEQDGMKIVKRLIGVPGDTVEMRAGIVYRNGAALEEPYAVRGDARESESPSVRERMRGWQAPHLVGRSPDGYWPDLNDWGPIVVPADSLFVMGDNRGSSYDGRYWGLLPRANVRGTPMFVYYSYDRDSGRTLPFVTAVRWSRIGDGLH